MNTPSKKWDSLLDRTKPGDGFDHCLVFDDVSFQETPNLLQAIYEADPDTIRVSFTIWQRLTSLRGDEEPKDVSWGYLGRCHVRFATANDVMLFKLRLN